MTTTLWSINAGRSGSGFRGTARSRTSSGARDPLSASGSTPSMAKHFPLALYRRSLPLGGHGTCWAGALRARGRHRHAHSSRSHRSTHRQRRGLATESHVTRHAAHHDPMTLAAGRNTLVAVGCLHPPATLWPLSSALLLQTHGYLPTPQSCTRSTRPPGGAIVRGCWRPSLRRCTSNDRPSPVLSNT